MCGERPHNQSSLQSSFVPLYLDWPQKINMYFYSSRYNKLIHIKNKICGRYRAWTQYVNINATIVISISTGEIFFYFFSLVTSQSATLSSATQHVILRDTMWSITQNKMKHINITLLSPVSTVKEEWMCNNKTGRTPFN